MNDEFFSYWRGRGYRPEGVPHDLGTRRLGYHSLRSSRSSGLRCPWLPRWRAPDRRGVQRRAPQNSVPEPYCRICGGSGMMPNTTQSTLCRQNALSLTSLTSGVSAKVNEKNAVRDRHTLLSLTSLTSFSEGGVMCGRVCERGRAPTQPSPLRETGKRSKRDRGTVPQSCDFVVNFGDFREVNGGKRE